MPVARDSHAFEPHEGVLDSRLREVFRRAVIVRGVVRRLARDDYDWDALQRGQLVRGRCLEPAAHDVGFVRRGFLHERELCGIGDRRRIGEGDRGDAPGSAQVAVGEPGRRAQLHHVVERRPARLHLQESLDQRRTRVGDEPSVRAGLGVGQDDCGTDPVEQRRPRRAHRGLLRRRGRYPRHLGGVELIEAEIAHQPRAGPLRVKVGLRPQVVELHRGKALLEARRVAARGRPVDVGVIGRLAATRLVDDVDRVAVRQEERAPAGTIVRRPHHVRPRQPAAVDQHDGVGVLHLLGDLVLDVHLIDHERPCPVGRREVSAADEEIPLALDLDCVLARVLEAVHQVALVLRPHLGRTAEQQRGCDADQMAPRLDRVHRLISSPC